MILFENIINSFESIIAHKMRSSLSMLGIIIGVSSVIILTAMGAGSQQAVVEKIQSLGANTLTISAGGMGASNVYSKSSGNTSLTLDTIDSIKNEIDGLEGVLPIVSGNAQIIYGTNNSNASIMGITPEYFTLTNTKIETGINFSEKNITNLDKFAIVGVDIQEDIFAGENPVGKKIKMGGNIYEIIGIIEEKGGTTDSNIFIPLTTAQIRQFGKKTLSQVQVFVENSEEVDTIKTELENYLANLAGVSDTSESPYSIRSQADILERVSEITGTFTLLLSGIAGISLLVGGIGVMNIMLVSVTERTREIGIRKAIGASKKDILMQFLMESAVLSLLGGCIGIILSFVVVYVLNNYFNVASVIAYNSIILSFGFSLFIGIFFGLLPSYKAAKLKPIDALRFE
ncbi:FtsX-like permease family protein [Candidatus Gracilibacteria bacterium]|nr:FtsX-like permease family protein [Candidatus Gracilibacteria bacterium]NUJ99163.1 FtsX-like permease family protein [Candidatus Gracilibacteria bacterium]